MGALPKSNWVPLPTRDWVANIVLAFGYGMKQDVLLTSRHLKQAQDILRKSKKLGISQVELGDALAWGMDTVWPFSEDDRHGYTFNDVLKGDNLEKAWAGAIRLRKAGRLP